MLRFPRNDHCPSEASFSPLSGGRQVDASRPEISVDHSATRQGCSPRAPLMLAYVTCPDASNEERERDADRASYVSKRSEEHTSELQSPDHLVCRLLLEKKK